jgi:hypothetical protein
MEVEDHPLWPQWRRAIQRMIDAEERWKAAKKAGEPRERDAAEEAFLKAQDLFWSIAHEV